jgi:hypothetical protein
MVDSLLILAFTEYELLLTCPTFIALSAVNNASCDAEYLGSKLDRDLGARYQLAVPIRVNRRASFRGENRLGIVERLAGERSHSFRTRVRAGGVQ